jgi:hypothetical protein
MRVLFGGVKVWRSIKSAVLGVGLGEMRLSVLIGWKGAGMDSCPRSGRGQALRRNDGAGAIEAAFLGVILAKAGIHDFLFVRLAGTGLRPA